MGGTRRISRLLRGTLWVALRKEQYVKTSELIGAEQAAAPPLYGQLTDTVTKARSQKSWCFLERFPPGPQSSWGTVRKKWSEVLGATHGLAVILSVKTREQLWGPYACGPKAPLFHCQS